VGCAAGSSGGEFGSFRSSATISGTRSVDSRQRPQLQERGIKGFVQDLELIMDDGRIFTIYNVVHKNTFHVGDRVEIDYSHSRLKRIKKTGSIYIKEQWFSYAD
jgi:hypothetical protein